MEFRIEAENGYQAALMANYIYYFRVGDFTLAAIKKYCKKTPITKTLTMGNVTEIIENALCARLI